MRKSSQFMLFLLFSYFFLPFAFLPVISTLNHIQSPVSDQRIVINGNVEFIEQAELKSWPGRGSTSKPYLIEGLNLIGPFNDGSSSSLLSIANVDLYFIIQKCIFRTFSNDETGYGIFLDNVSHALISGNHISNNNVGIQLSSCSNITLDNNLITDNSDYGIRFFSSTRVNITNNVIKNHGTGCSLKWSGQTEILHNFITQNYVGLSISECTAYNRVADNVITNNHHNGIYLRYSLFNLVISYNEISSTGIENETFGGIGIVSFRASGALISYNSISNNRNYGLYLAGSLTNQIIFNNFINNNFSGISQAYSHWWAYYGSPCNISHNYWSDWTSPDNNTDDIVDFPYPIFSEGEYNYSDPFPRVSPNNVTYPFVPAVYPTQPNKFFELGDISEFLVDFFPIGLLIGIATTLILLHKIKNG